MPRTAEGLLVSPAGKPAIGTLERLTAVSLFTTPGVPPEDGGDYLGETKIRDCDWNSQRTVHVVNGGPVYVDENGETWAEGDRVVPMTWRTLLAALGTGQFDQELDAPVCVVEPYDDGALLTGLRLHVADANTQFDDGQLLVGDLYFA